MYIELAKSEFSDRWISSVTSPPFPSTMELLSQGGDTRLALSHDRALNKYGCTPFPDPGLAAFGSSTASVISDDAFTAADLLRNRLMLAVEEETPEVVYAHELERVRREFFALSELDRVAGLQMVFGASGTDLHLIAAQLANGSKKMPALVIMTDTTETGNGVAAALAGRHFSSLSSMGDSVTEGATIKQANALDVVSVPMRLSNGKLRPEAVIDAEVEALVEHATQIGQQVLLILVDNSKTGLISPSPACAIKLKQRHPEMVDVLVDACQFRISSATLRAYLKYELMVIVTGSKFLSGPVFSGGLLIPSSVAKRLLSRPIAAGMRSYSSAAEWPEECLAAKSLNHTANFGLLLRWQAALEELRQFKRIPNKQVTDFVKVFAMAVQRRLKQYGCFSVIPGRTLDRYPLATPTNWDDMPTIFSFVLLHEDADGQKRPLSHEETLTIYRWLQLEPSDSHRPKFHADQAKVTPLRCQLGQPVICASYQGRPVSALRISLSSRLIVEAALHGGRNAAEVIQRALRTLDNAAALIHCLP